jgi:hypothetical protein
MEDNVDLGAEPTAEARHGEPENTARTVIEPGSPSRQESNRGYEVSRLNAVRHGILSADTVLWWEDKLEYQSLLSALVQEYTPRGPTEEHLVEEIASVIWRKRRLRLAEAGSYQRGVAQATNPCSDTLITAFTVAVRPIMDIVSATLPVTAGDLVAWERRNALLCAIKVLKEGKPGAYNAALAELDEQTRTSWQERLAPEPKRRKAGKYPAEASELFTADATALAVYLDTFALPECLNQLICAENRSVFRTQVLGEALDCDKLERLGRYEVQLDRKLERMLAMLLRLQEFRRSNKVG